MEGGNFPAHHSLKWSFANIADLRMKLGKLAKTGCAIF